VENELAQPHGGVGEEAEQRRRRAERAAVRSEHTQVVEGSDDPKQLLGRPRADPDVGAIEALDGALGHGRPRHGGFGQQIAARDVELPHQPTREPAERELQQQLVGGEVRVRGEEESVARPRTGNGVAEGA